MIKFERRGASVEKDRHPTPQEDVQEQPRSPPPDCNTYFLLIIRNESVKVEKERGVTGRLHQAQHAMQAPEEERTSGRRAGPQERTALLAPSCTKQAGGAASTAWQAVLRSRHPRTSR